MFVSTVQYTFFANNCIGDTVFTVFLRNFSTKLNCQMISIGNYFVLISELVLQHCAMKASCCVALKDKTDATTCFGCANMNTSMIHLLILMDFEFDIYWSRRRFWQVGSYIFGLLLKDESEGICLGEGPHQPKKKKKLLDWNQNYQVNYISWLIWWKLKGKHWASCKYTGGLVKYLLSTLNN